MIDFLGQELNIGDNVVYVKHERTSSELIKSKIIGFTNKMVKIEFNKYSWKDETNVMPNKLIKYIEGK